MKYTIKLVDHVSGEDKLRPLIQQNLQKMFDKVFQGTSDQAIVSWGSGRIPTRSFSISSTTARAVFVTKWPDALQIQSSARRWSYRSALAAHRVRVLPDVATRAG